MKAVIATYYHTKGKMLRQCILILSGITVFVLPVLSTTGNLRDDPFMCALSEIDTRLSIVSEFVEGIRRKLPADLKDVCSKYCLREKPLNCSECENCTYEDKPGDCSNCSCEEKPIDDKNCTLEETLIDDKNCSCEEKVFESKNCSYEEILNHCRKYSCEEKPTNCSECRNNTREARPLDCSDLYLDGFRSDGIYEIWPQGRLSNGSILVYCDMKDGGWTVIQRRGQYGNAADYFFQDWDAYREGFGNLSGEFWIGNEKIYTLTNQKSYEIKFDLTDWEHNYAYAIYNKFWIEDELRKFTLHVYGYNGTAGDSLNYNSQSMFTTKDNKNDVYEDGHCSIYDKGAWWYKTCTAVNLNGVHGNGEDKITTGTVYWYGFKGSRYSLRSTAMKIRPTGFES